MSKKIIFTENTFNPDWVSPPGETIRDCLARTKMSSDDLAEVLGLDSSGLGRLLDGQLKITEDLAERLAVHCGASQEFWLNLDTNYRRKAAELGLCPGE